MKELTKFGDAIRAAQGRTSQRGQGNVTRIELSLSQLLSETGLQIPGLSSSISYAQAYAETNEAPPTSASPRPVAGGQRNDNSTGTAPQLTQRILTTLFDVDRGTRAAELGAQYINPSFSEDLAEFTDELVAQWLAEGDEIDASAFGFSPLEVDPNQLAVRTSWSRKLLLKTSPEHQRQMMRALLGKLLDEISRAAFVGTGTGNEPGGVFVKAGHQVPIAEPIAPTRDELAAMIQLLEESNRSSDLVFAVSSQINNHFNTSAGFMESGLLFGRYPVLTVQDLPPEGLVLGRWADLYQAVFDVVSLVFKRGASGEVEVVAMLDADVLVRPGSFVIGIEEEPEPDA